MILNEDPVFGRLEFSLGGADLEAALERTMDSYASAAWLVLGFAEPPERLRSKFLMKTTELPVDNFFRLAPSFGFERAPSLLTLGIRASRFAPILFWEAFHALAVDGVWIDVDDASRCRGSALSDLDHPDRAYYRDALTLMEETSVPPYRLRVFRKTSWSRISAAAHDEGWTFGILTSGPSPNAERMVREILALDLPAVEVVICGPMPEHLPADPRIRQMDLERPEPRGWISRKKNMIAAAAKHENLCILHDRFFIPREFARALKRYGNVFSFLTFPQVHYPDRTGECIQRYPDYQVLEWTGDVRRQMRTGIFDGHHIFHPQYSDFHETAFCCGGLYVAKKSLWNFIRQNEALFHCEWEDAVFGFQSQQAGIPHRVNPYACVESTAPHPMLLTSIHLLHPSGRMDRAFHHITAHQRRMATERPEVFKPLLTATKRSYCAKLAARFNAMPIAERTGTLTESELSAGSRLWETWSIVSRRLSAAAPRTRMELFGIFALIAELIYNHPAAVLQLWTRETERVLTGMAAAPRFSAAQLLRDAFTFSWKALLGRGWRAVKPAAPGEYAPLRNVVSHFREAEAFYPVTFSPESEGVARQQAVATVPHRARLLEAPENFRTVFFHHSEGLLPRMDGWDDDSSSIH